jgi:dipeptidyl aminopeptidase/acylaminoacyl peptidase
MKFLPLRSLIAIALLCATVPLVAADNAAKSASKGSAMPENAIRDSRNVQPTDTGDRLELMTHEIYGQRVDTAWLLHAQLYGAQVRAERVLFPANTADKEAIPGYLFTPAAGVPAGKKLPGLLIIHGSFHTNFEWRWFKLVNLAVAQGYAVMFPEYRGSSGYGPTIYQGDYGTTDVADCVAAADYLATLDYVDPKRTGVIGHSRGGMVTVRMIERHPQRFQAAVEICGLMDFVAYMAYKPESRRAAIAKDKGFGGKQPDQNFPPYVEVSPINFVPDIQTPLYAFGVQYDSLVPHKLNTGRLIELLRAYNKTFESHVYENPTNNHSFIFADSPETRDCFKRSFEFLAKYLKP